MLDFAFKDIVNPVDLLTSKPNTGKAHKTADCPVLGTKNLFKIIKKCSGQDIVQVMHHWILASGCSIMTANFNLNKKRGQIEFGMRINNHHLRSKSKQDTLTIRVHETEVTYDRAVKVEADEMPTEAEFVASLVVRKRPGQDPVMEASEASLKAFQDSNAKSAPSAASAPATPAAAPPANSYPPLEPAGAAR